jgi:hypothetical protein
LRPAALLALLLLCEPVRAQSLDGVYITVGPVGAASRVGEAWVSAVGAEVSVVRVAETRIPAALGVAVGGISHSGLPTSRLWLEAEIAVLRPLPLPVGLGAGLATELHTVSPPRLGAQATLWFLAGLVPFVRAGAISGSGTFIELGVMLKIPARRFP